MLRTILVAVLFLVLAAGLVVAFSYWRFARSIDEDIERLAARAEPGSAVASDRVASLPPVVQRYLAWTGVVGKPIPDTVRLAQRGRIRSGPGAAWMTFEALEVYSVQPPGFVWKASFPKYGLPLVIGRDLYVAGAGSITMKLLGTFAVADEAGDELAEAGLLRFLNEMMWFPQAYLADNVTWTAIDDTSAEVTVTDGGVSATGTWFFDTEGRPVNFRASRYNTTTGRTETWETPLTAYGTFDSVNMPTAGRGVWNLAEGDFAYIELEVTGVVFDPPDPP